MTCLDEMPARHVRPQDGRDPGAVAAFLDYLVDLGHLDRATAERAAQAQRRTLQRIDIVLAELGLVPAQALLAALSAFCDMPRVEAHDFPNEPVLAELLLPDFLKRVGMVPLQVTPQGIEIATSDPFDGATLKAIAYHLERPVRGRLASAQEIEAHLARLYADGLEQDANGFANGTPVDDDDIQRLKDIASEAPVIRFVNRIIATAVRQRASDIHIEPVAGGFRVRFRIDGLTREIERLDFRLQAGVASRIKLLAKLNIAERRLPQDGRANFVVEGRAVDLRISSVPVLNGESLTVRILDQQKSDLDFSRLGFEPPIAEKLADLLATPNGIILVTGPTGSGKTTTLYSALRHLNSVDRTIFSIEDPIEYQIAGINQIQIKPSIGLDFADCLRSVLRQDPDVILVGEMRDGETARVGIQAALTGHLVLSTLHTNSAAAAVPRLVDMGVDDYLLASTLNGIVAQRLVRQLCSACAVTTSPSEDVLRVLHDQLGPELCPTQLDLRQPVGCAACQGSGYRGRSAIAELLVLDGDIRRLVKTGISQRDIEMAAQTAAMQTLLQSGLRQVALGRTSFEEVLRVTRLR